MVYWKKSSHRMGCLALTSGYSQATNSQRAESSHNVENMEASGKQFSKGFQGTLPFHKVLSGTAREGGSTTRVGNVETGPRGYPPGVPAYTHCNTHTAVFLAAFKTEFWEPELQMLKVLWLDVPIKQEENQIKNY